MFGRASVGIRLDSSSTVGFRLNGLAIRKPATKVCQREQHNLTTCRLDVRTLVDKRIPTTFKNDTVL